LPAFSVTHYARDPPPRYSWEQRKQMNGSNTRQPKTMNKASKFALVFSILFLVPFGFGQSQDTSESVPEDVLNAFKTISFWKQYKIDYGINPFYLRGDFDGDTKPDFAVLCVRKTDQARFVAIVLSRPHKTVFVALDPDKVMAGWEVFAKSVIRPPGYDGAKDPPKLMGDGIILRFSITVLLFWDGTRFTTYALDD